MLIGPPPKFHGTRDILHTTADPVVRGKFLVLEKGRFYVSDQQVRMIMLSTDNLDESIKFYCETLGFTLKFRDGAHYAALNGGSVTLALASSVDHPLPGHVVVGIKTDDVDGAAKAVEEGGGAIVRPPYDDAHERRAVVYDSKGNGLVFYSPLQK